VSLDYKELQFMCGIEIHQQLEGHKLFCNCPTEIRKGNPDFKIIRRLRASAGESGMIDQAALHEQKKQKYFVYYGFSDITCAVELDEAPPMPLNKDSLTAVLQVAKMLNCNIVDRIEVMRKTVVDGSNTSGFQRTMLVGQNGFVEVNDKKFGIESVCLEEEACQIIERNKDFDVYNLSRLGIPLIEIATAPDITTSEEAKQVAAKIGMILRSTHACKRGIGSIRQDVNVSIKRGNRVEIKGFQDFKKIPKALDIEIERHLDLIKKGKPTPKEVRKVESNLSTTFLRPMPGGDRMYPETDIPSIIPDVENIKSVKTIDERAAEMMTDFNLTKELALELVKKEIDFVPLVREYAKLQPKFIANIIINAPKEIKKRFKKEINVLDHLEVFRKANRNDISSTAVFEVLCDIAHGKKPDYNKYAGMSDEELEKEIKEIILNNPNAPVNALMGMVMAKHRGKVAGKKVMELLKIYVK